MYIIIIHVYSNNTGIYIIIIHVYNNNTCIYSINCIHNSRE